MIISYLRQNNSNVDTDATTIKSQRNDTDVLDQNEEEISNLGKRLKPYEGTTTRTVNFRSGPGTEYRIIAQLSPDDQLYIYNLNKTNGYYKVVSIQNGKIGFVHSRFVAVGDKIKLNTNSPFQSVGSTSSSTAKATIANVSAYRITLDIQGKTYELLPSSKIVIEISPGEKYYLATAPGVIPTSGIEKFVRGGEYLWTFSVV